MPTRFLVGELSQCSLPGRNRQLYLVLSDCLTISLSQLFGGTGVCSWSLLVCVTMNPPKEGLLEAVGDRILTLGWVWEAGFTQPALPPFISSVKFLWAIWGFTEDSTSVIHFPPPFPTNLPHTSATLTILDSITSFYTCTGGLGTDVLVLPYMVSELMVCKSVSFLIILRADLWYCV